MHSKPMKRYKITLMVPHATIIEAVDMQEAHNEASRMLKNSHPGDEGIEPKLHSIEPLAELQPDLQLL